MFLLILTIYHDFLFCYLAVSLSDVPFLRRNYLIILTLIHILSRILYYFTNVISSDQKYTNYESNGHKVKES